MSAALFCQLLVCAISLAVYMVGIETHRLLSIGFCIMMTGITSTVVSTYIYCWFAENVSRKLSATGDIFYEYSWYRLPARQQQLFVMAILRAKIEFNFTGFGLVVCSLETFATVTVILTYFSSFQSLFVFCMYALVLMRFVIGNVRCGSIFRLCELPGLSSLLCIA